MQVPHHVALNEEEWLHSCLVGPRAASLGSRPGWRCRSGPAPPGSPPAVPPRRDQRDNGWGARIRTWECWDQNPVPYRLATPQVGPVRPAAGFLRAGPLPGFLPGGRTARRPVLPGGAERRLGDASARPIRPSPPAAPESPDARTPPRGTRRRPPTRYRSSSPTLPVPHRCRSHSITLSTTGLRRRTSGSQSLPARGEQGDDVRPVRPAERGGHFERRGIPCQTGIAEDRGRSRRRLARWTTRYHRGGRGSGRSRSPTRLRPSAPATHEHRHVRAQLEAEVGEPVAVEPGLPEPVEGHEGGRRVRAAPAEPRSLRDPLDEADRHPPSGLPAELGRAAAPRREPTARSRVRGREAGRGARCQCRAAGRSPPRRRSREAANTVWRFVLAVPSARRPVTRRKRLSFAGAGQRITRGASRESSIRTTTSSPRRVIPIRQGPARERPRADSRCGPFAVLVVQAPALLCERREPSRGIERRPVLPRGRRGRARAVSQCRRADAGRYQPSS